MTNNKLIRTAIVAVVVIAALAAAAMLGLHFATGVLKNQVQQALGAESEIGEIVVGWSAIEVRQVRMRAPKGWPAAETLRAARIVIEPDLRALISSKMHVHRIRIEDAYLSVLRSRDGRLRLLPSLLEGPAGTGAGVKSAAPAVGIGSIELHGGVVEFFDATITQPAHKITIEQLEATLKDLHLPDLSGRTRIQLDGKVKGVQRDGKLAVGGWFELADRNSEIVTRLQGVDLVALQPYLIKASEIGVRRGALDLDLKSTIQNNRLHAPGTITLTGLELDPGGSALGTFMGVPRQAVIASLQDRKDQIVLQFTLDGDLGDPQFSLNESMSKRIGAAVASTLGIGIEGLAHGVGSAAQGVGGMVKKLFGK